MISDNQTTHIMKKIFMFAAAILGILSLGSCSSSAPKVLVLYYSQSSNTRTVAEEFASELGADIEEIVPVNAYDGTYQETISRGKSEMDAGILPEINPVKADLSSYDVIFLGYPIWFGTYAPPVASFIESADLSGKKIVPFCTFGSGGLSTSVKDLKAKLPDSEILPGYGVRAARVDAAPKEIDQFLKEGGFIKGEVTPKSEFGPEHPVTEEESAIFDAAVKDYPMINASAVSVSSRNIPGGVEYFFTAADKPREDGPAPGQIKLYVLCEEGQDPVFTQVLR